MDKSEGAELQRAINLSLQTATGDRNRPIDVDDDNDSDDQIFQADLRRALEASKAEASVTPYAQVDSELSQSTPQAPQATGSSFLSDRAQLERARLERQKRLRKDVSLGEDDIQESLVQQPAKRQHISTASGVQVNGQARANAVPSSSRSSTSNVPTVEQLFWDGELRQIANRHADPRKDGKPTFRLTEILGQKSELSFAVISSYALMISWIYEFFDPSVPVILVAQPDESGRESIKNVFPNWIRTTPFLRNGRGCMHMKFMLLFYKSGRLRLVVSTANLVDFDYRDIENTAWLQDIPLRPSPIAGDPQVKDDFPAMFQRVLHAVNVRPALANLLKTDHPNLPLQSIDQLQTHWDWSKVKAHLVPSIAGKHEGWPQVTLTGHPRLMKVVRSMGMRITKGSDKEVVLECQGSSLGNYSTQWMNEFHWSARGQSAEDWLDEPRSRRIKLPWPSVKIIFPTLRTVKESVLGEPGGGTIFCRRNQWEAAKFPRELFYNSKSRAGGLLMHSKMIMATFRDKPSLGSSFSKKNKACDTDSETETDDSDNVEMSKPFGWAYVGSHNFTPSAWGTLSGSAFNPVLNITNYELGIVFPLQDQQDAERVACWEQPPKKYNLGKDKPWMQEESMILQSQ